MEAVAERPFADLDPVWGKGIVNSDQWVQIVYLNALSLRPYGQEERANNNGVAMTTLFQGVARWRSKR